MRQNQITIKICRFGSEVPRTYPEQRQEIEVYSDSNNFYQALSIAYAKAIEEILEWETYFGCSSITTNADGTVSGELLGRSYFNELDFEHYNGRLEMFNDLLMYIENSQEIVKIIMNSTNKEEVRKKLNEKFGFTQRQITSVLRIRFDMLTGADVKEIKNSISEIEKIIENNNF